MAEEAHSAEVTVMLKFDMPCHESTMSSKDVKSFVLRHRIPLDLHPCASSEGWMMDQLPKEVIGAGGRVFQETFFQMKRWKKMFFFLDRRVIPNAMPWRHHDSDVNDTVPDDDFSILDVQKLTERFIDLRPMPADLLFRVVTMSEYFRFPFLFGASIVQGTALSSNDPVA
nr:hypothetical protein [Tanacetum cinerariifolium]